MITTREEVTTRIREGKPLGGLRMRSVREAPVRGDATPEQVERVRAALGDAAASSRIVPMVWSTERRADDGHTIKVQPNAGGRGWTTERFGKNPVVLWQHRTWSPRIGDAVVYADGDKLRALVSFMPREISEVSWSLGEIAATRGHAASVQWDTIAAVPAPDEVRRQMPWALDILEADLLEGSLVNIGADEDAIAHGRSAGIDTSAIARSLEQAIDEAVSRGDRDALERMLRAARPEQPVIVDLAPKVDFAAIGKELAAAFTVQLP